ncbi:MAG: RDD family protein [Motiliproteus sp.]|nr:RDD family protein [Motiliproteus sp.]MCW9051912.1 RDD family protein [Motiliproteus sp.]
MHKFPETPDQLKPASLIRRLAAMLYDTLLVAAIWMVIGAIAVGLNEGEAVRGPLFNSALFISAFLFFAGFWSRNGQTLGMQAWQLRVQTPEGYPINLMQALLRFFTAAVSLLCLGAGYWWMLIDKEGLTWHDRYSETRVVQIPKPKKK